MSKYVISKFVCLKVAEETFTIRKGTESVCSSDKLIQQMDEKVCENRQF